MNCFQIIKSVLDEAYNQISGNESEKDEKILGAIEYLREEYKRLSVQCNVNYNDPVIRFAYIYVYVTSHANLVCNLVEENSNLSDLFNNQKVNVACIGGGPGSDFLGILKYLMTTNKSPNVRFQLCDKERAWAESWIDVDDKVDPEFRISTSYLPLDVTKRNDWEVHTKYLQSDLFTMIYFMSEVYSLSHSANDYFMNLFSQAKPDSLFLFVDNNAEYFYNWFDRLAQDNSISILQQDRIRMMLPWDEQKSDLGEYCEKFSPPKVTANVAYRIGIKN